MSAEDRESLQLQSGLFNQLIPEELEARILSLLDLRSLLRCRFLSQQWKNSVDSLYRIWGAMARRVGFADPEDHNSDGEAGERIGLQKLLKMVTGDWWFKCSLCPVADKTDLEESDVPATKDLKLTWVCLDKIPNGLWYVLLVTALDRRNALLHKWRLRLPYYPAVSWRQVVMFKETRIGWLAAVEFVGRHLNSSQTTNTIDNKMDKNIGRHNSDVSSDSTADISEIEYQLNSDGVREIFGILSAFKAEDPGVGNRECLQPGNRIAIIPLESCGNRTAPAVPICFLSLPFEELAENIVGMGAFRCGKIGCELVHLLILTKKHLLLYSSKPVINDESETQKSLHEPDSILAILNGVQTSDDYTSRQDDIGAGYLYEVTQTATSNFVMPGEYYFVVIVLEWKGFGSKVDYSKVVLARSKCQSLEQMTSIRLDNRHTGKFLLRTEEIHSFYLCIENYTTGQSRRRFFRLAKIILTAPDSMELEYDECCYEFFEFFGNGNRMECFERGKKFWYIMIGPILPTKFTCIVVIYRVGNFSPILKIDLRKTIPQRAVYTTHYVGCDTYACEWVDRGLTLTEGSELQPLMIMGWSCGFELLIGWSTTAQRLSSLCSKTKIILDLPKIWPRPE